MRTREGRVEVGLGEERESVPKVSGCTETQADSAASEGTPLDNQPLVIQLAMVFICALQDYASDWAIPLKPSMILESLTL